MGKVWYAGCRPANGAVSVQVCEGKVRSPLPLHLDLWSHSPTGFEWGYLGSGPAQLALALIAEATGCDNLALACYQSFKADVVAGFGRDRWRIDEETIRQWVLEWVEREHYCPSQYTLTGKGVSDA